MKESEIPSHASLEEDLLRRGRESQAAAAFAEVTFRRAVALIEEREKYVSHHMRAVRARSIGMPPADREEFLREHDALIAAQAFDRARTGGPS